MVHKADTLEGKIVRLYVWYKRTLYAIAAMIAVFGIGIYFGFQAIESTQDDLCRAQQLSINRDNREHNRIQRQLDRTIEYRDKIVSGQVPIIPGFTLLDISKQIIEIKKELEMVPFIEPADC